MSGTTTAGVMETADAPQLAPGLTVAQARRALAEEFRRRGLESPELDARLLVGHTLGLDHRGLTLQFAHTLTSGEAEALAGAMARRLAHEPVARIVGVKEFWSLPLAVDPAVLVPRPETETVVEAVLSVTAGTPPARIADLGTGSGAILLALLSEFPGAMGIGTDRDPGALALARANATRLGFADRAAFVLCDFGAALVGQCDLVVSNPPYIPTGDIATLAPEVRHYDPRPALDGGCDGLLAYRAIAADAARLLARGGWLAVEIGVGQADAVAALFRRHGLAVPGEPHFDLAGRPRVVLARRHS